ncbi:flagellar hook assembly protein FlgD [Thalassotalea sp. PLHSN55]|uniref:flagellar hook assembly protein FlgD n=1 Tax=Thalassotalea sp. PLHSN55 TaxID=3435888 RepID=UPI003F854CED
MSIAITNQTTQANTALANAGQVSANSSAFGLKNEFLTMMVAQIQNQDPLEPLDGTEYVGQLAQFSMVEGQEYIRAGQAENAELLYTQQVLQSTSLIGKSVLVPADSLAISEGEIAAGVIPMGASADSVELAVKDLQGNVVSTQNWSNVNSDDIRFELDELPQGSYTFEVNVVRDENVFTTTPLLSRDVERVMLPASGGDIQLKLAGMGSVSLFSVSEFSQNNS